MCFYRGFKPPAFKSNDQLKVGLGLQPEAKFATAFQLTFCFLCRPREPVGSGWLHEFTFVANVCGHAGLAAAGYCS
eukprot:g50281.t1